MRQATPAIRTLAWRLLAAEANGSRQAEAAARATLSAFAKLRLRLTTLVGVEGFQALLARSLVLARAEVVWLEAVHVKPDATLEGFTETALRQPVDAIAKGSAVLLAQLLGLLVTFIGAALTLGLVREVWPGVRLYAAHVGEEEKRV